MPASPDRYELLRTRLKRFTRMLPRVEAAEAHAVHRTRVGSRRLRELLPVLQLEAKTTRKLGRQLRGITRRLGDLRELDVAAGLVGELRSGALGETPATRLLAQRVETARQQVLHGFHEKPVERDLGRVKRRLTRAAEQLRDNRQRRQPDNGWRWALEARIARRAGALSTALERAGTVYLPERLHAVRIALKKLRYAVELAVEAAGESTSADLRALRRAQDALGKVHDLQVLIDFVRQVQASLSPPDFVVEQGLDDVVRVLENDCRRLHARHVRERDALLEISTRLRVKASLRTKVPARRVG